MENKKVEISEKINRIEELTSDFSISKYNLLKISFLIRLIEVSDEYSNECDECKTNSTVLASLIEEIPHLDDIAHRKPYEIKFNSVRKHFHKSHGFIPPYYYTSRWSLAGALFGAIISSIIALILTTKISFDSILAGITMGVILGYLLSSFKEIKYRNSKKII